MKAGGEIDKKISPGQGIYYTQLVSYLQDDLQIQVLPYHDGYHGFVLYYKVSIILYTWKCWWELNLVVGSKIAIVKNIGGFKFGSLVRDRHTYMHK